jgi:hypothetical protein
MDTVSGLTVQSIIMIGGLIFAGLSSWRSSLPEPLVCAASRHKFSLGSADLSLSSRTIWVMIIYGVTENLRNLLADQNFVQKYSSVPTEREARRSIWIGMSHPMTAIFLYIGTACSPVLARQARRSTRVMRPSRISSRHSSGGDEGPDSGGSAAARP